MNNLMKMLGVLVVTVVIPLAVILGIWAGYLPESLQVGIGMFGVIAAIAVIVLGHLYMIYSDIKTKRYSK